MNENINNDNENNLENNNNDNNIENNKENKTIVNNLEINNNIHNNIENDNNIENKLEIKNNIENKYNNNIDNNIKNQNNNTVINNQNYINNNINIKNNIINGNKEINTNSELINVNNFNIQNIQQGVESEKIEISYERNELILLMAGSKCQANKSKEKTRNNQYSLVDTDDPELFDGKIKCVRLKCILFGIITAFLNTIRLFYLIFLHLGYPAIIFGVRFTCAVCCFCCILFGKEEIIVEPITGYERIDYPSRNSAKAFALCKNCGKAFYKFIVNLVKCPCWIYSFIIDCIYDIKNRALDNARTGCYKFIHYDFGLYEKHIEDPFNNYMKKRHIILTTDPDDQNVIYGDACKDNTII